MADTPRHRDPDWLEGRYWGDGHSLDDLAEECGVSVRTITKYMDRHDIGRRTPSPDPLPMPDGLSMDEEEWESLTVSGRRYHRVAVPNRERLTEWKLERGCERCGYNRCADALVFHHTDPDDKKASPTRLASGRCSWETIMEEAEKCELLCANCHHEHHGSAPRPHAGVEEVTSLG